VIGDYSSAPISSAAANALVRLLGWRLDVAHVDPLSTVTAVSTGNPRFPAGTPVRLRAISGHRDTGPTSCPGDALYAQLNAITRSVAATGLPKIYSPAVRGDIGGIVRFTARLSNALPWTVTVMDTAGRQVALGAGIGTTVDWSWDATTALPGRYTYAIDASFGARPVTGTLGRPLAPLTVTDVSVAPRIVTPNGDGRGDTARVRYKLGAAAIVTASLTDGQGATIATLFSGSEPAGRHTLDVKGLTVPDGRYLLVLGARASGDRQASATIQLLVDRTLAGFTAEPKAFSPNGDGHADAVTFFFALMAPAQVSLRMERAGSSPSTLLSGLLQPGPQQLVWDGTAAAARLPDGRYRAVVDATDSLFTVSQSAQLVLDTLPPRLRILSVRRLLFWLSEPATVRLGVDGAKVVKLERAGRFHVPHRGPAHHVSAVAIDAAGNQSPPVRSSAPAGRER
jgi:hypothetical protein